MLTTAPHLYIRRPSPTTAEFTVTTCPPPTIPLRLLLLALLFLRAALLTAAVLTLHARFFSSLLAHPDDQPQKRTALTLLWTGDIPGLLSLTLRTLHTSYPGRVLNDLVVAPAPSWAVALASLAALYASLGGVQLHTTESVLVLRGLGIQTRSSRGSFWAGFLGSDYYYYQSRWWAWGGWGWGHQTRFIPTEKIRDVLINEAFRGFEVRYYLVVLVEGEEDVVVLFPRLLPRRKIVEAVWRGVRGCLFEGAEGPGRSFNANGEVGGREKG